MGRKKLEEQLMEMEHAFQAAEKNLGMTKKKLDLGTGDEVELRGKLDATTALLEKLLLAKHEVEEDLRRKMISSKIEEACRKILPEKTVTPPEKMAMSFTSGLKSSQSTGNIRGEPGDSGALKATGVSLLSSNRGSVGSPSALD